MEMVSGLFQLYPAFVLIEVFNTHIGFNRFTDRLVDRDAEIDIAMDIYIYMY